MKVEGHRIAEGKSLRNLPRALEERPIRLKQAPTHQRQRHAASHHENVRSRTIRALHKELSRLRTTHFELEQRLIGLEQEIEEVEREFIDFSMDRLPVEQSMRRNRIVRRRGQVVSKSGRSLNIASKGSATSKLSTGGAKQAMLTQKVASPAPSSSGAILNHKGPSDELDLESIQLQDNRKPDDPAKEGHLH